MDGTKASQDDEILHLSGLGLRFDYRLPAIWCDINHRRVIMAALVKAVYKIEKDQAAGVWKTPSQVSARPDATPNLWQTFHYDMIYLLFDKAGSVFGAVFQSRLNHNKRQGAPHKVVALRGTILSSLIDIQVDFHIGLHMLPCDDQFGMALRFVRQEVDRHGADYVCLTGHSKGASLALLVGRELAEENCFLETHLFNPPHPTLPVEPLHLPRTITLTAQFCHNVAANTLSRVVQDESTRNADSDAFQAIRPWFPHLYVNAQDAFCNSYLRYVEANRHLPELSRKWFGSALSLTPHSIRSIVCSSATRANARPYHLIPSAYLHVNRPSTAHDMIDAHKLKHWWNLDLQLTRLKMEFDTAGDLVTKEEERVGLEASLEEYKFAYSKTTHALLEKLEAEGVQIQWSNRQNMHDTQASERRPVNEEHIVDGAIGNTTPPFPS